MGSIHPLQRCLGQEECFHFIGWNERLISECLEIDSRVADDHQREFAPFDSVVNLISPTLSSPH